MARSAASRRRPSPVSSASRRMTAAAVAPPDGVAPSWISLGLDYQRLGVGGRVEPAAGGVGELALDDSRRARRRPPAIALRTWPRTGKRAHRRGRRSRRDRLFPLSDRTGTTAPAGHRGRAADRVPLRRVLRRRPDQPADPAPGWPRQRRPGRGRSRLSLPCRPGRAGADSRAAPAAGGGPVQAGGDFLRGEPVPGRDLLVAHHPGEDRLALPVAGLGHAVRRAEQGGQTGVACPRPQPRTGSQSQPSTVATSSCVQT